MHTKLIISVLFIGLLVSCHQRSAGKPHPETKLKEPVDSIVVMKKNRQMQVYHDGRLLKTYHVCLGFEPVGPKHFQNDGKTPEGMYHISRKNPYSGYHKSLGISYPSDADRRYARRNGKPTGGDVMIHGLPNGKGALAPAFTRLDWTYGCIALTDPEIDELYTHVEVGTRINILP